MKPLFGFDLTNDKKNQTFYADKFLIFPCYELPTFEALTGLTATEEA